MSWHRDGHDSVRKLMVNGVYRGGTIHLRNSVEGVRHDPEQTTHEARWQRQMFDTPRAARAWVEAGAA